MLKKSLGGLKKSLSQSTLYVLGVSRSIVVELLAKFNSYFVLYNVCIIFPYNIINSGIHIFHNFSKVQYLLLQSVVQSFLSCEIEIVSERKRNNYLSSHI